MLPVRWSLASVFHVTSTGHPWGYPCSLMKVRHLACILILAATGLAQDHAPYRVTHYDLTIAPDFAARHVRVDARIKIDRAHSANELSFRLSDQYSVESLTISGAPARFTHKGDELLIPVAGKETYSLEVHLLVTPGQSSDDPRTVIDNDSLFLLWSDAWYPMTDTQWATVRTTVRLPRHFEVIAPGRQVRRTYLGETDEIVFATQTPTLNFSVFADRRWIRTEHDLHGMKFITLLHPESQKYADKILTGSSEVLDYFTRLHGYYPFEQFAFVTMSGIYARRAQNGFIAYSPQYLEKEMARTGYDAHETSLLWWGYATRGKGPGSYQWFEGLGDYVEFLYSRDTAKPLTWNFIRFRDEYLKTESTQEPRYDQLNGRTPQKFIHGRYPWVLGALHQQMGDQAFRRTLRTLFDEYKYKAFTVDEFVALFAREDREVVQRWRKEWLDRAGVPELIVDYTVDPKDNLFRVSGTVLQEGNLYSLRIPVELKHNSQMAVGSRVDIREKVTPFEFYSPEKPVALVLDPEQRYLMKVTYHSTSSASESDNH